MIYSAGVAHTHRIRTTRKQQQQLEALVARASAPAGARATRFSFENNRNAESDWPVETFEYADEDLQRVREDVRFTYADFVLCDRRHAHHFAVVPRERWTAAMVPVADWLALSERDAAERRRELLVGQPGDPEIAVDERQVGDRAAMRIARAARGGRRVVDLREHDDGRYPELGEEVQHLKIFRRGIVPRIEQVHNAA